MVAEIFRRLRTIPGIGEQRLHFFLRRTAPPISGIKIVEHFAIALALAKNRIPAQSGLRAFQNQKFEQHPVVVYRHTPFGVVIRNIPLI